MHLGATGIDAGLSVGYANGLSLEAFVHAPKVLGPLGAKVGLGYAKAADAILDSTPFDPAGDKTYTFAKAKADGKASESGSALTLSLDATYPLGELVRDVQATLYGGGRYGKFSATEQAGGNVTQHQTSAFGVGGGVLLSYPLPNRFDVVADLGVDQFFNAPIYNGTIVDGKEVAIEPNDAAYTFASQKFVHPGFVFKVRLGLKMNF